MKDATDALEAALDNAVALRRNHGEVATGLYLSGGLDSAVVGALGNSRGEPLPAFSHGFDATTDEIPSARKVSTSIGAHSQSPYHPRLDELTQVVRAVEQTLRIRIFSAFGLWQSSHPKSQSRSMEKEQTKSLEAIPTNNSYAGQTHFQA